MYVRLSFFFSNVLLAMLRISFLLPLAQFIDLFYLGMFPLNFVAYSILFLFFFKFDKKNYFISKIHFCSCKYYFIYIITKCSFSISTRISSGASFSLEYFYKRLDDFLYRRQLLSINSRINTGSNKRINSSVQIGTNY